MTTYAALTDGTTTVTFASPANGGLWYRIEDGWAPRVAGPRRSGFGVGPYEDVTEEIPVSVGGSNAGHLYANLHTLKTLCDQAENWYRAQSNAAVTFNVSPEGATISSAASPMKAAVYSAKLNIPQGIYRFPSSGSAVWSSGLSITMTRRGAWVYTSGSTTASAASNPAIISAGFASSIASYSHVDYRVGGFHGASINTAGVHIITAPSSNYMGIQEASGVSVSSPFSHVSGSANVAYGGSVVRYTPAGTTEQSVVWDALISGMPSNTGRYGFWATIRNNSTTTTFQVRIGMYSGTAYGNATYAYTPYTTIDTSSTLPRVVFLGTAPANTVSGYKLFVTASSASGTLDVNYVVIAAMDDPRVTVNNITGNLDFSLMPTTGRITHTFDPRGNLTPTVTGFGQDGVDSYQDVLTPRSYTAPYTSASTIAILTLATAGSQWVVATSGGSVRSLAASLTRYDAYTIVS